MDDCPAPGAAIKPIEQRPHELWIACRVGGRFMSWYQLGHRNFIRTPRLKVLEFDPNLGPVANLGFQGIESSRSGAGRIVNVARGGEGAVVAGAKEASTVGEKIDKTAGVRANHVERLDL